MTESGEKREPVVHKKTPLDGRVLRDDKDDANYLHESRRKGSRSSRLTVKNRYYSEISELPPDAELEMALRPGG